MIRINLLPKEVQERGKGVEWIILGCFVLGCFGLVGMASYFVKKRVYEAGIEQKARWSAELADIKNKVAQVEQLDAQKNLLNAKKNTVVQLLMGRLLYPIFMEQFFETLPRDIWITDFKLTEDGSKNIAVEAATNALSIESVADWLQTLESKSERFSGATLSAIELKPAADAKGKPSYSFTMKFTYRPPPGT